MITPMDIQNKQFGKGVRGYKEDEVDQFLDMITLDYEKVMEENRKEKEKIAELEQQIQKHKNAENSVTQTLDTAKALMRDISASAEKRAEILLKNAELDAQLVVRSAKENIEKLHEEYKSLKNRLDIFKTRYRSLLESELEKFDTLSQELFYSDQDFTPTFTQTFASERDEDGEIDIEEKLKSLEDL